MAAETNRRGPKSSGLIVRPQPVSDKSYVESVVGFINDVVPQAKQGEKETVLWVKFEHCDINDYNLMREEAEHNANHPPILVILGYTNGVQIWCIPASGEAQEVLSLRDGPVKFLRILPTPEIKPNLKDRFTASRPLIAVCDSTSAGEQFCSVNFVSLKSGDAVECLKYSNQISDLKCSKRVLAVVFQSKIIVYDACNLKEILVVTSCYTAPGLTVNPAALGTRWLAFANKKLVPVHQSGGGMAGDGVQSYAATIIHAAKTITKGLSFFGETVASTLGGQKPPPPKTELKSSEDNHPGIVTVIDTQALEGEVSCDEESEGVGLISHFPAHAGEPLSFLAFDPSGVLLLTACAPAHRFHLFRLHPHPAAPSAAAAHHLYTLHRGDTTAKVQDVAFSLDSRWVTVSTMRGTTHIFPITPYGGPITVRTHTSPRVVNRLSRFQRSAGLDEMQTSSSTGRNSPVLSASPSSSGTGSLSRAYEAGGGRLPPYPHPLTLLPLAQLKQTGSPFPIPAPRSPSRAPRTHRRTSQSTETSVCVSAVFAAPRAWLGGSPNLARDKRDKPAMDSLFIIDWHGNLTEYILEPRPAVGSAKTEDSAIELDVIVHAQWSLLRPISSYEVQPPLSSTNPLMAIPDSSYLQDTTRTRKMSDTSIVPSDNKTNELEESWLSEVEMITHAGPHRRLWMGPQFSFQTFQHASNTTVLSPASSALLSHSPPQSASTQPLDAIFTEDINVHTLRPARSNPVAMPGSHQANSGSPGSLLLIEASSGSFEQLPIEMWGENVASVQGGKEDELKESLADAMSDFPFHALRSSSAGGGAECARDAFPGSCEDLSSGSSHSGSVSHTYDSCLSPLSCNEHTNLLFSNSTSDSS